MKISYNWLKQYIDIPETAEEIGKTLTDTGLEVESVEPFETVKGGLKGLVIGEVLTCSKHPNADKLSVTTVNVGDKILPIVCGAANVAAGQRLLWRCRAQLFILQKENLSPLKPLKSGAKFRKE